MKIIKLTKGKETIVDDDVYEKVGHLRWYCTTAGYARRKLWTNKKHYTLPLHRFVMNLKMGDKSIVDHIDGNPLNNLRENLRLCTKSQNGMNRKMNKTNKYGYKGVRLTAENHYNSYIQFEKKRINIGTYATIIEAAKAYDVKARELFGEFAKTNF